MSVRCMGIGDPHFKTKNRREMELFVKKTIEVAKEYKPDFIVNLGDTLDTHEKIHVVPLTQSIQWMEEISKIAPLYLIIGNHDRPNNSATKAELHPFNGLHDNPNIIVVDDVVDAEIKNHKFLFVPYVPPGNFIEKISSVIDLDNINVYTSVFAHQEFYGSKMGAITSNDGDKWPLTHPIVISGHIHEYQRPQSNIIYTGTPFQHAFGDSTKKTVSLITYRYSNKFESEENEIAIGNIRAVEERIDLGLPKKRVFKLGCQEVLTWSPPEKSLIKLIIYGTNAEIKATMRLSLIKQWEKKGIKIDTKTVNDHTGIFDTTVDVPAEDRDLPYIKKLKKRVESDPRMNALYDKLFGIGNT